MLIRIVAVGRLKAGGERELVDRYHGRAVAMARGLGFSGPDIVELAESKGRRTEERQADEGSRIRERAGSAALVVLDETAPSPTSEAFASRLAAWRDEGRAGLAFVVGGPDGLSSEVRQAAAWSVSFGRLTLPHQIVRALLAEQIYRALTIIAGHPYHRSGTGE
ncbi:23S rRNA (pseudouridine(1915)-N(3))-methyltransferase RlmH [Enterovirga rhinocerotis]|uniref:Ribosomal RNA large subunit methyltransferase H n=1 Tax=Enterovirga rhinocerotis TaxID=1339210 RepID=A0A4R7CAI0_9HYPH|nr:23S rRNA (pseudouridine(1915)-N(3))-methyltransferase RlmH [Enterovirga rhinocerotis]TDR94016.1 23S rRNA (pseudouridine1915-N3)-methyltransferase [Enterovirga rhinocerotis]